VIQCPQDVVNKELPALRIETVRLDPEELDQAKYQELVASEAGQALAEAASMDGIWQVTESLSAARRILGELKAGAVARYVRELLENDPEARILLFAHHRSVMSALCDDLSDIEPGVRVIDGDTSEVKRAAYIHAFEKHGPRVLVLGIGTVREGITLVAANRVVFAEASWVPSDNYQAICRAWRIGQVRPVLAEFVCVADTLDEAVTRVCARKSRQLSELL
jgi:SNF2 family DNA or RNA helicase